MDRHFAKTYGSVLLDLETKEWSGTMKGDSKAIPKQEKISPSAPLNIPALQVSTVSRNDYRQSPPANSSPEFYMLGDLMTPRDNINMSVFAGMNRSCSDVTGQRKSGHHQEGSNLVLLSARPESYKGLTESESYRKYFQPLVERGDLDTSPTMLLGSLDSGPRALFKLLFGGSNTPSHMRSKTATEALYQTLASKKLSRFKEYAAMYPEAAFVYVGDNGQGDVLCAEALTNNKDTKVKIVASFIHKVSPTMATLSIFRKEDSRSEDIQNAWRMRGIHLKRTHLGMARGAFDLNLISIDDLRKITISAVGEFQRISSRYNGRHAGRHLGTASKDLNTDILLINEYLESKGQPAVALTTTEEDDASGTFQGGFGIRPELSAAQSINANVILD